MNKTKGTTQVAKKKTDVLTAEPHHERIRDRAYELYAEDGYGHGRDVEHWLRAEAELGATPEKTVKRAAPKKRG